MQFDVLMLEIHGPPLTAEQTLGIRSAAIFYLQHGGRGISEFKIEEYEVEGFIERTGTKEDGPLPGASFCVDLGTKGGILRKVRFVIPWETIHIQIEEDSLLIFGNLTFPEKDRRQDMSGGLPPTDKKLLH